MKYFELFDEMRSPARWLLGNPMDERGQAVNPWQFGEGRVIDLKGTLRFAQWAPEDGQPEKVGQYRVVSGMRIDPSQVGDAHIFRPWGWDVALIVSEYLKQAMEAEGFTGLRFTEV